jgi:hypothetical protein
VLGELSVHILGRVRFRGAGKGAMIPESRTLPSE